MDWGLAKVMEGSGAALSNDFSPSSATGSSAVEHSVASLTTAHGTVLGTPGYMAPEQERGEVDSIDQRTDVFGFGSILSYLLRENLGSPPGKTHLRPLHAICGKAMAADMASRYSSVQELAADVGRYLDEMPVSAYRENIFERARRLLNRNRVAVVLVLAYLFMRLLFILFSRR
jgi:eukaryotic-like serine/threonine-protein kinase